MKKAIMTLAMLLAGLTAGAQGRWTAIEQQADELKGKEARTIYTYTSPGMGTLVIWDWDKPQFRIAGAEMFAVEGSLLSSVSIRVGIYDDTGALIEKFDMLMSIEENHLYKYITTPGVDVMKIVGHDKYVRKIFDALQSGKGYVRIVASRYDNTDFDMKITPYIAE